MMNSGSGCDTDGVYDSAKDDDDENYVKQEKKSISANIDLDLGISMQSNQVSHLQSTLLISNTKSANNLLQRS